HRRGTDDAGRNERTTARRDDPATITGACVSTPATARRAVGPRHGHHDRRGGRIVLSSCRLANILAGAAGAAPDRLLRSLSAWCVPRSRVDSRRGCVAGRRAIRPVTVDTRLIPGRALRV